MKKDAPPPRGGYGQSVYSGGPAQTAGPSLRLIAGGASLFLFRPLGFFKNKI